MSVGPSKSLIRQVTAIFQLNGWRKPSRDAVWDFLASCWNQCRPDNFGTWCLVEDWGQHCEPPDPHCCRFRNLSVRLKRWERSGYRDSFGNDVYLPPADPDLMRDVALAAGVRFVDDCYLDLICPGSSLHRRMGTERECQVSDCWGVPRLTCSNSGCEGVLGEVNLHMRAQMRLLVADGRIHGIPAGRVSIEASMELAALLSHGRRTVPGLNGQLPDASAVAMRLSGKLGEAAKAMGSNTGRSNSKEVA